MTAIQSHQKTGTIPSIPLVAQADTRWKDAMVGFSQQSIGGHGSALACIAMLGAYAQRHPPKPLDALNEELRNLGGFYAAAHIRWGVLNAIYPRLKYIGRIEISAARGARPDELQEIYLRVSLGMPVIITVNGRRDWPQPEKHFVLVTGFDRAQGAVTIHDPWTGAAEQLMPRYGKTIDEAVRGIVLFDAFQDDPNATPILKPLRD